MVYADGRTGGKVARVSQPVKLKIGGCVEPAWFTVTNLNNGYDGILGMPWLMEHELAVQWKRKEMVVSIGGRKVCLKAKEEPAPV